MNQHEGWGRPRLEIVRNYEDLPEDEKVIEAYCDELLIDKKGLPRNYAISSRTPFAHDTSDWAVVLLRRDSNQSSYSITFFGESEDDPLFANKLGEPIFEVDMRPYNTVFPGRKAPGGARWLIEAGNPGHAAPTYHDSEPSYFRQWLEDIWGPLPKNVQTRLGITQTPHSV